MVHTSDFRFYRRDVICLQKLCHIMLYQARCIVMFDCERDQSKIASPISWHVAARNSSQSGGAERPGASFCSNVQPKQRLQVSLSDTLFAGRTKPTSTSSSTSSPGAPLPFFSSPHLIFFSSLRLQAYLCFVSQAFSALIR